jgi:hypothetical protein
MSKTKVVKKSAKKTKVAAGVRTKGKRPAKREPGFGTTASVRKYAKRSSPVR